MKHAKNCAPEAYERLRSQRKRCKADDCIKYMVGGSGGYCWVHTKKYDQDTYNKILNPCKIDGCNKHTQVGGYCTAHFKEYDPDAYKKWLSQLKRCKVKGCEKYAQAGEYCWLHTKEYDPDSYDRMRLGQSCAVDGCIKHALVDGYCSEHAQQYTPEHTRIIVIK